MIKPLLTAAFVVVSVVGCSPFGGTEGELGHGQFFYRCADATDLACEATPSELTTTITSIDGQELPIAVAVGAPFAVVFQRNSGFVSVEIDPASPAFVTADELSTALTFERAGTVSILAMGPAGDVIDFTDVTAWEVNEVALVDDAGRDVEKIELPVGGEVALHATARGTTGEDLAGALAWSVSGAGASVTPNSSLVVVKGLLAGDRTISVKVGGASTEIPVSVTAD